MVAALPAALASAAAPAEEVLVVAASAEVGLAVEAEPAVDGGKDDAVFVLVARVCESHEQ